MKRIVCSRGFATRFKYDLLRGICANPKENNDAGTDPRNTSSIKLMKRLGMGQEAHHLEALWFKGEWADDVVFAILAREWPEVKEGLEEQPGDHGFVQDPSSTLFYITQEKEQIMTKQVQLANPLLWASAIVTSAVFQAPAALTLLVLPSLAAAA